jgi:hypothetical protein
MVAEPLAVALRLKTASEKSNPGIVVFRLFKILVAFSAGGDAAA